jgi:hypothetical protein
MYYIQKYTYILKLLLNVVTVGIETLVVSKNTFLYACVKEVCCLWTQPRLDTFHQLFNIVEALWSHPVLQIGKQVVVRASFPDEPCQMHFTSSYMLYSYSTY